MDTALEAAEPTEHYEDFSLRGVGLAVQRGSVAAVFGPKAAGKSTLLRMLAGPLARGDVKLDNATLEDVLLSFIKGA